MKASIIITSFKEPKTIKKAIESTTLPNIDMWNSLEFLVVAPDNETIQSAKDTFERVRTIPKNKTRTHSNKNNQIKLHYKVIRDTAEGKPNAINMAVKKASGEILILTDGDMYISDNSIRLLLNYFSDEKVGGVSGHPVSRDKRNTQFGYYGHLFCAAAHKKRLHSPTTPMSGYLYAIRNDSRLWPLPKEIRAEDAYISTKLLELGYKLEYEPNALAYVKFPQNMKDWLTQKTRSLGGNVQLRHFNENSNKTKPNIGDTTKNAHQPSEVTNHDIELRKKTKKQKHKLTNTKHKTRSIKEDLKMAYFPLTYAKTPKEFLYSLLLYPLRLYLWTKIYIQDKRNSYSKGRWKRIESTK